MSQEANRRARQVSLTVRLIAVFTVLAIIGACYGLFVLARFTFS